MLKKITGFSVNYPVTVTMVITGILLLGYISFQRLGIDLFPDLNNPRLYVEIKSGERPPEEIEEMFVDRVEALAIRQAGVTNVSSVSRVGQARVEVEYTWGKDMDEAFLDLSKALAVIAQNEEVDELNITQYDPNAEPVMLIAFQRKTDQDMDDLRKVAENYIRNELIRLEGIADVEIDGGEELEVVIETNDYLLKAYNITTSELVSRINSFNQNVSGGSVVEMGRRYVVKGMSELTSLSDLENVIVKMARPTVESTTGQQSSESVQATPVLLKEVAKVYYKPKDRENLVTINGVPALGLSVYKETKYNTVQAVDDLKEALKALQKALPGYTLKIVQDQGDFISSAINEVRDSAIYGIILAVFVLLLFLRKIGPTLIVSFAIPISIVATFVLMYFDNLTMNIMTLGGLALGAGMLVDNAIVVIENIFRLHENGENTKDAAINGTSQVGGAIIASTLTTIVVFLPIVYLHGASGELFKDQALTVTYSLLCSLVAAIFMIPMFYYWMYRKKKTFVQATNRSVKLTWYGEMLTGFLKHRGLIIFLAFLIMGGGYLMLRDLGSEFMPQTESRDFYVDIKMPEGTQLQRTSGAVESVERVIRSVVGDDLYMIYAQTGPSSGLTSNENGAFEDQNMATIKVILEPDSTIPAHVFMEQINKYYPSSDEIDVVTRQEQTALQSILGNESQPVVVEISGEDQDELENLSVQVMNKLKQDSNITNLVSSVEGGAPEVEVVIDRYRAGLLNVSVSDVVNVISQRLEGTSAGQMDISGELSDITIKMDKTSLSQIEDLKVSSGDVEIPVRDVASIRTSAAPREILHNNQNRIVKITADIVGDIPLDKISQQITQELSEIAFPNEYKFEITGEEAQRKESMDNLTFALILSLILVYMVLASQFESLVHPFTIILTIPLAIVGGIGIFYIQGAALNIMAYIGIIMLAGIAVNDSIILVDAINQLQKEGYKLKDAIVEAGQRRIRPILMTTLTTILALLPLTFGFGESASLRSPMAWAVIGGLITSTLLTLVVIPCFYYVIETGLIKLGLKKETR
ncbi:efflux RND transporter permease subunit [Saccharicrinis sp. FJH62]|uniref:efflux RND transporter permease subunit n=1 Tax=Saccharicrinis sp. FJH62 TaxID=3344657 RepID=UPI0035D4B8DF